MEAEANVDEEGEESEQWHDQCNCLPMRCILSIWFINVSLDVFDNEEPEDTWNEVLDSEAPVQGISWFPPLKCALLLSAQLSHRVGEAADAAHGNLGVPLLETQLGNHEGWNEAEKDDTKHKSENAPWNLIDKHKDETDYHEVGPERESQVLD